LTLLTPRHALFPYTTLFRSGLLSVVFGTAAAFASLLLLHTRGLLEGIGPLRLAAGAVVWAGIFILAFWTLLRRWGVDPQLGYLIDRKSTRLNSSHVKISYAV